MFIENINNQSYSTQDFSFNTYFNEIQGCVSCYDCIYRCNEEGACYCTIHNKIIEDDFTTTLDDYICESFTKQKKIA